MKDQPTESLVAETHENGVLTLRLGAAPAHPLSLAMIGALHDALVRAGEDDEVRAIVLCGQGRIFCAGHDLKEIRRHRDDPDQGRAYLEALFADCARMMLALAQSPKPTLAVVEGVASAGGLQLMASCDMAYAGPDARFCLPGVNNGGFCTTPAVAVSRKLSRAHMAELALSGEMFDAPWALSAGLINRILPASALHDYAQAFASRLATRHTPAITAGKAMLERQLALPLEQAYAEASVVMVEHFMDPHRIKREFDGS